MIWKGNELVMVGDFIPVIENIAKREDYQEAQQRWGAGSRNVVSISIGETTLWS